MLIPCICSIAMHSIAKSANLNEAFTATMPIIRYEECRSAPYQRSGAVHLGILRFEAEYHSLIQAINFYASISQRTSRARGNDTRCIDRIT